jgi:hypothetical protein
MFDQRIWDLKDQAFEWANEKLVELETARQPYHGTTNHWADIKFAELILKDNIKGGSMITAEKLAYLTSYTADELTRAIQDSGYPEDSFLTAKFLGITNGGQFCYSVQYMPTVEDDEEGLQTCKVFLSYNATHGTVTADY